MLPSPTPFYEITCITDLCLDCLVKPKLVLVAAKDKMNIFCMLHYTLRRGGKLLLSLTHTHTHIKGFIQSSSSYDCFLSKSLVVMMGFSVEISP